MHGTPMVRLTLDHMRHEIVHAFGLYADTLKGDVDHEVKAAIERFDFATEVGRMADTILRNEIESALKSAFQELRFDRALKKALVEILLRELSKGQEQEP